MTLNRNACLIASIVFTACATGKGAGPDGPDPKPDFTSVEPGITELLTRRVAATNSQDWNTWQSLHTENCVRTAPELSAPLKSSAEMRAAITPVSETRLTRTSEGNYQYLTKKGLTLTLTAADLVRRLVWLTPPRRVHLTNFHGVFSSHSKARALVTEKSETSQTETPRMMKAKKRKAQRPRLDFATLLKRTFGVDVWSCDCGGKRRVLAIITTRRLAAQRLRELGLQQSESRPPMPMAQAPPQLELAV